MSNDDDSELDGMLAYADALSRYAAGEDMRSDPNWPLPSFDARDWAASFMKRFGERRDEIDERFMLAWFANALMRGFDEHARRTARSEGNE
jgi:hypothetical protein